MTEGNKGSKRFSFIIELIEKYLIFFVILLNLVAAMQHFFYHLELSGYHGDYRKFMIILNIMYGFIFFYIAAGLYLEERHGGKSFFIFNLVWWSTNTCVVLAVIPDITTLSQLRKYIPLPFEDIVCISIYFFVQISMSGYLVYKKLFNV